jgi:hypothetical protein
MPMAIPRRDTLYMASPGLDTARALTAAAETAARTGGTRRTNPAVARATFRPLVAISRRFGYREI